MRKILITIMIITSGFAVSAQTDIGIYLGTNFAKVNMQSPELSTDTRTGFQGGVFFRMGDVVYGQAGAEYQAIRVHFREVGPDFPREDDVTIQQFKVPLYAGLNLIPVVDNIVNVRVYAGPTFAYVFDVPANELEFTKEDFGKIRIDGSAGAGLDILLFSLDVGYTFGINELFTDEFSGKTHYAFVNAGISF